jgi:hypothetical protein
MRWKTRRTTSSRYVTATIAELSCLTLASTPTQIGSVGLLGTAPSSGLTHLSQASRVTNASAPAVNRFSIMRAN